MLDQFDVFRCDGLHFAVRHADGRIGAALDQEALLRGNSVYFPDRVVPMLPEALSNGLCSLNPKVDRLCMVCEMNVNAQGKVTRAEFYEAVMRSKARLTYSQVNDFLSGKSSQSVPRRLHKRLRDLHGLYKAFAKNRARRGAIELDLPMTKFELNEDGEIARIVTAPRNDAHRLIEECMIAANVQAAKFLRRHRVASLYRVHARPDPERFDELRQYLVSLGLKVPHSEHVEPIQFNKLIEQVAGRAAVRPRFALPGKSDLGTVRDSLGNLHLHAAPVDVDRLGRARECFMERQRQIRLEVASGCWARLVLPLALAEQVAQAAEEVAWGDPEDDATVCGPLITEGDADRVIAWVDPVEHRNR